MINTIQFGKHEAVPFAEFGEGDILIANGKLADEAIEDLVIFFNHHEKGELGKEFEEYRNKKTDDIQAPKFVMRFKDPQSITVLIEKLLNVQYSLFKAQYEYSKENTFTG